ncbi:hypothetical protein E4U14_004596 [Claviceps sp. LM454 group G7]|nr:hypothetical protein E4U14_004596 [Claviceps sp. LM454 group G7]
MPGIWCHLEGIARYTVGIVVVEDGRLGGSGFLDSVQSRPQAIRRQRALIDGLYQQHFVLEASTRRWTHSQPLENSNNVRGGLSEVSGWSLPPLRAVIAVVGVAIAVGVNLQAPVDLVVVSADNLTNQFFHYTTLMTEKGWLRRVFLDECHLAITAHSWRPNLIHLQRLRSISAPIIMLTATLPLHMEREFKETMLLVRDPCWLIRASTARKSTRYMVKSTVADGKLIERRSKSARIKRTYCSPRQR